MFEKITIATTNSIEGYRVVEYKGIVYVDRYVGTGLKTQLKSSLNALASLTGSDFSALSDMKEKLLDRALNDLKQKAKKLGANAIIGIDMESTVSDINVVHISANGTAVVIEPDSSNIESDDASLPLERYNELPVFMTNVDLPFTPINLLVNPTESGCNTILTLRCSKNDSVEAILTDIVIIDIFDNEYHVNNIAFTKLTAVGCNQAQSAMIEAGIPKDAIRLFKSLFIYCKKYISNNTLISVDSPNEVDIPVITPKTTNKYYDFLHEIEGLTNRTEIWQKAQEANEKYGLDDRIMEIARYGFQLQRLYGDFASDSTVDEIRNYIEENYG